MKIKNYHNTSPGVCLTFIKKSSYLVVGTIVAAALMAASLPVSFVSAQASTTPDGPTKKVIVRYSTVLGANTDTEVEDTTSGFVDQVYKFKHIPFGVYEVDGDGEESLNNSSFVSDVFEEIYSEPYGNVPLPSIGANPVNNRFSDTTGPTAYDGTGYAVAVLDTGVDKNHNALSGKVIAEACFSSTDVAFGVSSLCPGGVSFSEASDSGLDCAEANYNGCGHGTTVAGAIAMSDVSGDIDGDTINELFSGVAVGADIISINVFSAINNTLICGFGAGENPCVRAATSDQLAALDYLIDLDVGVPIVAANMSLGSGAYADVAACQAGDSAYDAYFDLFSLLKDQNIATVVANGNSGDTPGNENTIGSPACVENAVSVGATNILGDTIASYSQNSSKTTLLAPGGDFDGVNADSVMWLPDEGTVTDLDFYQGTSQATPLISGALAVLREKHPDASVDQLVELLQDTGTDIADVRTNYTVGTKKIINLEAALSTSTFPVINSFTGPTGTVNENADIEFSVTTADTASCSLDNGVGSVDVSSGTLTVPGKENYLLTCTGDFNDTVTALFTAAAFNSAPTQPNLGSSLSVTSNSENRTATISWNASEDTDGIDFYQVYLDNELIDTTSETSYTFTDLALELEYTARVSAVDTLGAVSTASADQTFVLAAVTVPTTPDTGLNGILGGLGNNMFMSASALLTTAGALVAGRKFF